MKRSQRFAARAAITFKSSDLEVLRSQYQWTGWKNRHWPADIVRPGLRVYGFDLATRRLFVLLELSHGGSFTYRSRREFARHVESITGWPPDLDDKQIPVPSSGQRPCTGITLRWKVVRQVDIAYPIARFPQIGWERLDSTHLSFPDGADLFSEGERRLRTHFAVERNTKLRSEAKAYWRRQQGRVRCVACGFDFEAAYGSRGTDFIELHHERPLATTGKTKNRPRDLKPLCSNCHRMVHRYPDEILTLDALRKLIRDATTGEPRV
ncbi:MAG: HNH endonuclease [Myxococcaceae bacterium]